jgi:hypothetical protein
MKRTVIASLLMLVCLLSVSNAQNVYGEMKLMFDRGYLFASSTMPDGSEAWFAVDLAVATTSVSKAWLGERARIQKYQGRADMEEVRSYFALGGVGFTGDVAGKAILPKLNLGGLDFPDANVAVLEQTPEVAGRRIAGIIGTDLLRRAEIAVFYYGARPRLLLKSKGGSTPGSVELPMKVVNGYAFVQGSINDTAVDVLLDTGSPESWFPVKTLRLVGASATPNSTRELQTLDGHALKVRGSNVQSITFGKSSFGKQTFGIAELGVFSQIPENLVPVLLGNSFFSSMEYVEINFADSVVRLKAS